MTLHIAFYDGEAGADALTHLCDVEGDVEHEPFNTLPEALRVLTLCTKRPDMPRAGRCFTVFIAHRRPVLTPLLRLDVYAHNGSASAGVTGPGPRWDTEPVNYGPDDDMVEIVRKVLAGGV